MLEIDTLKFRSDMLGKLRAFFTSRGYLELDTPSMSPVLPPDTGCELFTTTYDDPWTLSQKPVYLLPSHDYFLTKAVASLKVPVFQLSKCYRNSEVADRLTSPETALLEACIPLFTADEAALLSESLLAQLLADTAAPADKAVPAEKAVSAEKAGAAFKTERISLDDAFVRHAGFSLSKCRNSASLAKKMRETGIREFNDNPFDEWPMAELYELILNQRIEPCLPEDGAVFLTDLPSYAHDDWSLYLNGVKVAVSRTQKKDGDVPECVLLHIHVDRLIMLLAGKKSIESVIPFPFRLKKGYY